MGQLKSWPAALELKNQSGPHFASRLEEAAQNCHTHTKKKKKREHRTPNWCVWDKPYLESGEIQQSKTIEEAQTLESDLQGVCREAFLGVGRARLHQGAVEENAVEHVQNAHQIRGLESRRQPGGILVGLSEDASGPVEEKSTGSFLFIY